MVISQARGRFLQRSDHLVGLLASGECCSDEVLGDVRLLVTAEQDAIRLLQGPAGTTHLLIIGHNGSGRLVVNDETQVRLVETHSERDRRRQRLHAVLNQTLRRSFITRSFAVAVVASSRMLRGRLRAARSIL